MSYRHRSNVGSVLATLPSAPVQKPPKHLQPPEEGEMGFRTGKKKGELEEGLNSKNGKLEYHSKAEWLNLRLRAFELPDTTDEQEQYDRDFPPLPGTTPTPRVDPKGKTPMKKVETGKSSVSVLNDKWVGGAEARLKIERQATRKIRKDLTLNVNSRQGKAKEGVKKNSDMAKGLTALLAKYPELVESDGLLSRIAGSVEGQGQHAIKKPKVPVMDKNDPPAQVKNEKGELQFKEEVDTADVALAVQNVTAAAERLSKGKGVDQDANIVMQFIGCFVDGMTEVTEGKPKAAQQFDLIWPDFAKAFKLKDEDKEKLLNRVKGYKEIAGGAADTLSGKGTRKNDTRGTNDDKQVRMPNDPRLKIDDDNALIKNDISGSMHSSVMAQELAESLAPGGVIKEEGDSVLVKDKDLINARVIDALALTAGGMNGQSDLVMHTAFEMINGIQAITGLPPISQVLATEIMDRMEKGQSFTDAVEPFFDDEQLPWKN